MKNGFPAMKKIINGSALALMALVLGLHAVHASEANAGKGDFARGAKAWSDNCARCHNLRPPTEFRDDLWRPIVTHMRIRAGLTGQQARDILTFLQASN